MNVRSRATSAPSSPTIAPAHVSVSKLLFIIMAALTVLACGVALYALLRGTSTSRTAVVRVNTVLERYQGAQDARQEFQKKTGAWQANVDTLKAELRNMVMDYERERTALSPVERQSREQALRTKEMEVQDYAGAIMRRMEEEQKILIEGIVNQVKTAAEQIGKEHGYDLVLAIQDEGMLLYQTDAADATPVVLDYLRTHYTGSFKGQAGALKGRK